MYSDFMGFFPILLFVRIDISLNVCCSDVELIAKFKLAHLIILPFIAVQKTEWSRDLPLHMKVEFTDMTTVIKV